MDRLNIVIRQLENGYLIHEDDYGHRELIGKSWVAEDVPSLTALVGDLAASTKEFPVGVTPTPPSPNQAQGGGE